MMNPPKLKGALGKTHKLDTPVPLRTFLADVDSHVAIGSHCSFIYIGTPKDFVEEDYIYCDYYYRDQKMRMYYNALAKYNAAQKLEEFDGTPNEMKKPILKEHVPFLDRMVTEYWSRHLPDEPPMWIIQIDGDEQGSLWLEKETVPWLYKVKEIMRQKYETRKSV